MNSASSLTQPMQRRAAGVLPGQAEEVEPGDVGDAAAVAQAPVGVEDRRLDPGVVGPVAGRPDDGVDLELAAVREADRAPVGVDDARLRARRRSGARARAGSSRSACRGARAGARAATRPSCREMRAFVSHQKRSRPSSRCGSGFWREPIDEHDPVGRRELLRDLEAGVAAADDENGSRRDVIRSPVAAAVRLEDVSDEQLGERRDVRRLERTGRDDDLVGRRDPTVEARGGSARLRAARAL